MGQDAPFDHGREQMKLLADLEVTTKSVERTAEAIVSVVKKETAGRQGKVEGQPAHTREVKLGCVFTQSEFDKKGFPIRDPDSTTYTGAIETAEDFGKRIYLEAFQGGHESRIRRRCRMDQESRRSSFPRSNSDCRSLSRTATPVGVSA